MSQHSHMYNNREWRAMRAHQLTLEPLCALCLARGLTMLATIADHIIPHRGDYELFWNGKLQSLCKECHDSDKQKIDSKGYTDRLGVDGFHIDPNHPSNLT